MRSLQFLDVLLQQLHVHGLRVWGIGFSLASAQLNKRSIKGLSTNIIIAVCASVLFHGSATAVAQNGAFPLEPPDTTSPRGALFNLINNADEAQRVLAAVSRDYRATPGLFKSNAVVAQVRS